MTRTRFTILACSAAAAGLVAALLVAPRVRMQFSDPPGMHAMWVDTYQTLGQMVNGVDAIVLGTVQGTRPGRVVPTGAGMLPFTLVDLVVEQAIGGQVGGFITLEQTGGQSGDRSIFIDGDGGEYTPGGRVLLFLKRQPDTGFYYLVNPQGRFSVEQGTLNAVAPDDPLAQQLDTRLLEQAIGLIRAAR